jgi:type IV pilus assembly protein PilE
MKSMRTVNGTMGARSLQPPAAAGFSLIELMIALAIVGIITAVAVPSYSAYVERGQRAAAKSVLLQVVQAMERNYTSQGTYAKSNTNTTVFPLSNIGATNCVAVAPMDSSAASYCISGALTAANGVSGTGYVLTATPCGDSTGAACPAGANAGFVDPQCDQLTIDNTGVKGAIIQGASATPAVASACWQK